ncbi:hypothetical protein M0802_001539 [Mischocyttarus mexicanus]|nr:hypothetical protein M0802_001539 [Mischocyttarus mexicanus]
MEEEKNSVSERIDGGGGGGEGGSGHLWEEKDKEEKVETVVDVRLVVVLRSSGCSSSGILGETVPESGLPSEIQRNDQEPVGLRCFPYLRKIEGSKETIYFISIEARDEPTDKLWEPVLHTSTRVSS